MLRETYEVRAQGNILARLMELARIAQQERIDRTESSFAGNGKMTQKQFEESMELAAEAAAKWF